MPPMQERVREKVCPGTQEMLRERERSVPPTQGGTESKCVPHAGEDQRESVPRHTGDAQREKCALHTGYPWNVAA